MHSQSSPAKTSLLSIAQEPEYTDSQVSQAKLVKLQDEITESLSEIMNEFLNDFIVRKDRRLSSKCPTSQMHTYNLVVNKNYRKKIRRQVYILISSGLAAELQETLIDRTNEFVEALEGYLSELKPLSKILQIICLYDAYHTLQNASTEIGKIISRIYKGQKRSTDYLFCRSFYTKILAPSEDLLKQAGDYDKNHFAILGIMKMHSSLSHTMREFVSMDLTEKTFQIPSESEGEEDCPDSEPLYNLPIDDLVKYIEGKGRRRAKTRSTTAESTTPVSPQSEDYSELDREVDEFRQRIDIPITPCRPSLQLSQEFLAQLRKSLLRNKVN